MRVGPEDAADLMHVCCCGRVEPLPTIARLTQRADRCARLGNRPHSSRFTAVPGMLAGFRAFTVISLIRPKRVVLTRRLHRLHP